MKKIRVVQMIHGLPYGGAEKCVVDIINHADPDRFEFTLLLFRDLLPLRSQLHKDVKVMVVKKKSKFDLFFQHRLEKALKELQSDVVHTHLFTADFWGRLAAKKLGLPVVTTEHNTNYADGWLRNFIKKLFKDKSDYYVACSEAVKKYMQDVYEIKKDIEVVKCGVDLEKFSRVKPLEILEPFRLVILGRLVKQKGHAVALAALAGLKKYPWNLQIVGEGELKDDLIKLTKNYGLSERVKFLPPTDKVAEVLEENQILLMPSLWEGLGMVAMEAMASGRLVIASRVGGLPEVVSDGETGTLVSANNVSALTEKIKWCFEHSKECKKIAEAAQKYAQHNFGIKQMTEAYERIYCKLV